MSQFRLEPDTSIDRTQYVGAIEVAPAALISRFGPPAEGDRYKVSGRYIFVDDSGQVFAVYDWKATSLYDDTPGDDGLPVLWTPEEFWAQDEPYPFQVGGRSDSGLSAFTSWLAGEVG